MKLCAKASESNFVNPSSKEHEEAPWKEYYEENAERKSVVTRMQKNAEVTRLQTNARMAMHRGYQNDVPQVWDPRRVSPGSISISISIASQLEWYFGMHHKSTDTYPNP